MLAVLHAENDVRQVREQALAKAWRGELFEKSLTVIQHGVGTPMAARRAEVKPPQGR
jgi:uridine phosphorylase